MDARLFAPAEGKTTAVTNATSATAAVRIPFDCDALTLTNSSATATAFVRVTVYGSEADTMTGAAPTTTTDYPILPLKQVRRYVGPGIKVVRTIASAADGILYITPGSGL